MLPLYEAKMFHQFDHRWATYDGTAVRDATPTEKLDSSFTVLPRYWVAEPAVQEKLAGKWSHPWLLGWRDIARATDVRTTIASFMGHGASPEGGALLMLVESGAEESVLVSTMLNSFVFDFVARQKVGGTHLKYFTMRQLPVLPMDVFDEPAAWQPRTTLKAWMTVRAMELAYTSQDLIGLASELGYSRDPFEWDEERRALIRAELDAALYYLYGLQRADVDYIMDTFPIIRRKEWIEHGKFLTKERILDAFDRIKGAVETGVPYVSPIESSQGATA